MKRLMIAPCTACGGLVEVKAKHNFLVFNARWDLDMWCQEMMVSLSYLISENAGSFAAKAEWNAC